MTEVASILDVHLQDYAERIARTQEVATRLLPQLADIEWCNAQFDLFDRPDLRMKDPILMPQLDIVPDPEDNSQVGNFAKDLVMNSGKRLAIVKGTLGDYTEEQPIPVNRDYLLKLRSREITVNAGRSDQRSKFAFHRALCADFDVVAGITEEISSQARYIAHFGPEVMLMHAIMSRLVDKADRSVLSPDGTVNNGYLCSNHSLPKTQ